MSLETRRARMMAQMRGDAPAPISASCGNVASGCICTPDENAHLNGEQPMPPTFDPPPTVSISTREWSLDSLVKDFGFKLVPRISAQDVDLHKKILSYEADEDHKPLVIGGWDKLKDWPLHMFNMDWICEHFGDKLDVRNIHTRTDTTIPLTEFIAMSRDAPHYTQPGESARYYGKDAICPPQWVDWLQSEFLPSPLLPGGSNDLLHNLEPTKRVETLMCYLGIGDTFTPCHKDLCASSGQNLMCYTEQNGSSFWFMTQGSDAPKMTDYFQNILHRELDHENHVITLDQLKAAPCDIYVTEQKLGDLVLVPPRSCHQVVNNGGITVKTSWSRMTLKGLETALCHELPLYRRVCRQETYRVKSIIHRSLQVKTAEIRSLVTTSNGEGQASKKRKRDVASWRSDPRHKALVDALIKLLQLYDDILLEEAPYTKRAQLPLKVSRSQTNSQEASETHEIGDNVTCDFCGADIFNGFLECRSCEDDPMMDGDSTDSIIICPGCYTEGRTCECGEMLPQQCREFETLQNDRMQAYQILADLNIDTKDVTSPHAFTKSLVTETGTFKAAYLLRNNIIANISDRSCRQDSRQNTRTSHVVPFSAAITCRRCHGSRCFKHLLRDWNLHAVDALFWQSLDSNHNIYHTNHAQAKIGYRARADGLDQSQKKGVRPECGRLSRTYYASKYPRCRPFKQMKAGWYDIMIQEPIVVVNAQLETPPASPTEVVELQPPVISAPQGESVILSQPSDKCSSTLELSVKQRPLRVYVSIPPAPYSIHPTRPKSKSIAPKSLVPVPVPVPSTSRTESAKETRPQPKGDVLRKLRFRKNKQPDPERVFPSANVSERVECISVDEGLPPKRRRPNPLAYPCTSMDLATAINAATQSNAQTGTPIALSSVVEPVALPQSTPDDPPLTPLQSLERPRTPQLGSQNPPATPPRVPPRPASPQDPPTPPPLPPPLPPSDTINTIYMMHQMQDLKVQQATLDQRLSERERSSEQSNNLAQFFQLMFIMIGLMQNSPALPNFQNFQANMGRNVPYRPGVRPPWQQRPAHHDGSYQNHRQNRTNGPYPTQHRPPRYPPQGYSQPYYHDEGPVMEQPPIASSSVPVQAAVYHGQSHHRQSRFDSGPRTSLKPDNHKHSYPKEYTKEHSREHLKEYSKDKDHSKEIREWRGKHQSGDSYRRTTPGPGQPPPASSSHSEHRHHRQHHRHHSDKTTSHHREQDIDIVMNEVDRHEGRDRSLVHSRPLSFHPEPSLTEYPTEITDQDIEDLTSSLYPSRPPSRVETRIEETPRIVQVEDENAQEWEQEYAQNLEEELQPMKVRERQEVSDHQDYKLDDPWKNP